MSAVALFELVLLLLALTVPLALAARALGIPPAASFVVGGMVLALTPGLPAVNPEPTLIMALFLPPLLQASAFFTVWRDFRANLRPILLLAVGAVAFSTLAVGWTLKLLAPDLPWAACFALGAIVSPPDAVSAAAVLQRLRLPRRLVVVLEGESLINDAAGLVLYRFAVAAALTGSFNAASALATFGVVAAGGIGLGFAIGRGFVFANRWLQDSRLEITASFLVGWASYLAAEAVGVSGVLSTVTCGLVMGWHRHSMLSPRTRMEARATWGTVTFVLEALVFILIGLSLHGVIARISLPGLLQALPMAGWIALSVVVSRFVWVFPAAYLPRLLSPALRARDPYPNWRVPFVVSWAGMRGVVSLAAALALPEAFPGRDLILFLTFAVILVTVLLQGSTLGPLIRLLNLGPSGTLAAAPEALARVEVERAMLGLMQERAADPLEGAIAQDLLAEYRDRAGTATRLHKGGGASVAERSARRTLRLDAIDAGRRTLLGLHSSLAIPDDVLEVMEQELDFEELRFRAAPLHAD